MAQPPRGDSREVAVGFKSSLANVYVPWEGSPTTKAAYVEVVNAIDIAGLELPHWDYMAMVIAPAGTETYTFKHGGSTGDIVAVVVIVYTDATRADISTVTRTT